MLFKRTNWMNEFSWLEIFPSTPKNVSLITLLKSNFWFFVWCFFSRVFKMIKWNPFFFLTFYECFEKYFIQSNSHRKTFIQTKNEKFYKICFNSMKRYTKRKRNIFETDSKWKQINFRFSMRSSNSIAAKFFTIQRMFGFCRDRDGGKEGDSSAVT